MLRQFLQTLFTRTPTGLNFVGFDKYRKAGAYHWREVRVNPEYRALMEAVGDHIRASDVVLDIGCGDGAYLGNLSKRFTRGVGLDAEGAAIRLARAKFAEHGITNCEANHWQIGEALAFFEASPMRFDVVWSADVIEHLPDPAELLRLAMETLADDGVFVLGTPLFINKALVSPYHVKEFTLTEIRDLVASHFAIEREQLLPQTRRDGVVYADSYYLATCRRLEPGQRAS